jgi:hypothetical protein
MHILWLIQAVKRGVDCNERWLYAALIIHCIAYSVTERCGWPRRPQNSSNGGGSHRRQRITFSPLSIVHPQHP